MFKQLFPYNYITSSHDQSMQSITSKDWNLVNLLNHFITIMKKSIETETW